METLITFVAICDREIVHIDIPIEHNFKEIPEEEFEGVLLPKITVGEQVVNMLDGMDKSELMDKYDMSLIIDYYPKVESEDEIAAFMHYCESIFISIPELERPIKAIVSEFKDKLFGHWKTNKEKLEEVMSIYSMNMKAASGTIQMLLNGFRKQLCK
jgi:hypothetical protein